MPKDKGYNGWKNYETWNVALWLDNEQSTYNARRAMAQEAWELAGEGDAYPGQTRVDSAQGSLARALQAWVEEMMPDLGASMFSDLLGAALGEVDWWEIAGNYLEDVGKEVPENA